MADPTDTTDVAPAFETSDVEANLAMEQGLGVGARELAAQRDAGGIVTPDEDEDEDEDEEEQDGVEEVDPIARDTAVLGEDPEA